MCEFHGVLIYSNKAVTKKEKKSLLTPVLESLAANHSIKELILVFFLYRKFKCKYIHFDKFVPCISKVKKLLQSSKYIF